VPNHSTRTPALLTSLPARERIPGQEVAQDKNLTLTLDEDLLRAARKVAIDRNTSINQMVRDYLERLVREADQRQAALARLDRIFRTQRG